MNNAKKLWNYKFGFFGILIGLFACIKIAHACSVSYSNDKSIFPFDSPFRTVSASISNAIKAGFFREGNFDKLDFSLPGNPAYGDHPEFEVFNPYGPFNAPIYPDLRKLEGVFSKDTRVIFLLRRVVNLGEMSDYLVVVATGIDETACERRQEIIPELPGVLDLTPSTEGAITDKALEKIWTAPINDMCIKDSSGSLFYFEQVAYRSKKIEARFWGRDGREECNLHDGKNGRSCKYKGWQPKPLIPDRHQLPDLEYFKHPPPPSFGDYAGWLFRLSGLYASQAAVAAPLGILLAISLLTLAGIKISILFAESRARLAIAAFVVLYLSYLLMNNLMSALGSLNGFQVNFALICCGFFCVWNRLTFMVTDYKKRIINTVIIFVFPFILIWGLVAKQGELVDTCGFLEYEMPR